MLSEEVARASLELSDKEGDDVSSLTVRSVVHLTSNDVITSSSYNSDEKREAEADGVEREGESEEEGDVFVRGIDVELVAVLDPLSAAAQRASTLLLLVSKIVFLLGHPGRSISWCLKGGLIVMYVNRSTAATIFR